MRFLLLFPVCLLLCTRAIAQVPSYVPTDGLIGWWPFNGNANDESGNGNNGTANGASLTSDRNGQPNAAYTFNGLSDFIATTAQGPAGTIGRTLSFWVRTQSGAHQTPIDYYGHTGGGFQPILNNPCPGLGVDAGTGVVTRGDAGLIDAEWHHCALVFDPANGGAINSVKMYIDGVEQMGIACFALDQNAPVNTTATLPVIFGKTTSDVRFLDGDLDDIGIWERALTPHEIVGLFAGDIAIDLPSWLPSECLVAWFPFDGDAYDASGNGRHGIVNDAVLTDGHTGLAQSAYAFDGAGANIDLGNASELGRASTSFSILAWVRLDEVADERACIISNRTGSVAVPGSCIGIAGTNDPGPGFDAGELNISTADPVQFCSDQSISTGVWTHVAMTYDRDANMIRMYYDGTLVSEGSMSNFSEDPLIHHTIGYSANENGGIYPLNGAVDELALYNCALSGSIIGNIHSGSTTSIRGNEPNLHVVVAPNPTNGPTTIFLNLGGNTSIKILDMTGREVYTEAFRASGANTMRSLDLSAYAKGAYTLYIRAGENSASQRIMVE